MSEFGSVRVLSSEPVDGVLEAWREPAVDLEGCTDALKGMLQGALALDGAEVLLEEGRERVEEIDERVVDPVLVVGLRVEHVVGALVDEEALGGGGQMVALVLHCDHVQVHEVALHFAWAWWWIETGEC